jgi:hypothetical protein
VGKGAAGIVFTDQTRSEFELCPINSISKEMKAEMRTPFDWRGALRARVKSEALTPEPKRSFGSLPLKQFQIADFKFKIRECARANAGDENNRRS